MLLLTPALSLYLSKLLRGPLKWVRPVEGALAADSLIQAPRRTSATVAALMLSLALVIALGGMARASYMRDRGLDGQHHESGLLRHHFGNHLRARLFTFPTACWMDCGRFPGIAEVQPVRIVRIDFRRKAGDAGGHRFGEHRAAHAQATCHGGRFRRDVSRWRPSRRALIIADNLAQLEKLKLGETLEIRAPSGMLRLPIVGILTDFSNQLGTIFIDRESVPAVLERRCGGCVPHLSDAGRASRRMCGRAFWTASHTSGAFSCWRIKKCAVTC